MAQALNAAALSAAPESAAAAGQREHYQAADAGEHAAHLHTSSAVAAGPREHHHRAADAGEPAPPVVEPAAHLHSGSLSVRVVVHTLGDDGSVPNCEVSQCGDDGGTDLLVTPFWERKGSPTGRRVRNHRVHAAA